MKRWLPKILLGIVLIALPVGLAFWMRELASWRPQVVAVLPEKSPSGIQQTKLNPFLLYRNALAISSDERWLAYSAEDTNNTLVLCELPNGRTVSKIALHRPISFLTFAPDNRSLAIAWAKPDFTPTAQGFYAMRLGVALWDFERGLRHFDFRKESLEESWVQIRFSPDGKTLWLLSTDNLRAWNVASGRIKWRWHDEKPSRTWPASLKVAISQDCRRFFRANFGEYSVWSIPERKRVLDDGFSTMGTSELRFSADTALAVYAASHPTGYSFPIFETSTGRGLWAAYGETYPTFAGDKVIIYGEKSFGVYDPETGKFVRRLPGGSRPLTFSSHDWLYALRGNEITRQRLR